MTLSEATQELEALRGWSGSTGLPAYKERVRALYTAVTGKSLRDCNCKNIYSDAIVEIYSQLKHPNNRIMTNSKARLVKGVVLQVNGSHYTNANLTDEVAREFLSRYPMRTDWFEVLPPKAEAKKAKSKGK